MLVDNNLKPGDYVEVEFTVQNEDPYIACYEEIPVPDEGYSNYVGCSLDTGYYHCSNSNKEACYMGDGEDEYYCE